MKKVTINDIAEEAGVSKATVSRVMTNPELVKKATRDKILGIMEKRSYIPSQLAQGLAGTLRRTIGVVIDELSNFFFIEIAEGIDRVLSVSGYSMHLSSSRWIQENETKIIRSMISSRVDGILLAPVNSSSESIDMVRRSGIPFILINCIPDDQAIAYITCDNRFGGYLAADYIKGLPGEQTIMITGFYHQSLQDRIDGFKEHYPKTSPVKHYPNIRTFEDGYDLIPILLTRDRINEKKTKLFVTNDNVAIGMIKALLEKEISIPDQVSIVGYDNIRLSSISRIPLTTVSQSIRDMGRIGALELLEMINDPKHPTPHHLIKPKLIVRSSAC